MTFSTYYDSTDTGLGGMTQTAGQAIAFLDKVLVNGYNATTLTSMTQVGTLVTATLTAHGYRDLQFVIISGATPSGYNGTWQIVAGSTTANTFQFNTVTSGMSPATGTLGCIVASLGWTKPFNGTNLAVYRQASGNRFYLNIDDTANQISACTGYEIMTSQSVGTYPFPTAAQVTATGAVQLAKSNAAAIRRTILWGNGSIFYLYSDVTGNSSSGTMYYFGDPISFKTGDAYCTTNVGVSGVGGFDTVQCSLPGASGSTFSAASNFAYVARPYTQMPGALNIIKTIDLRCATSTPTSGAVIVFGGATGTFTYPAPVDGNLWQSPIYINETGPNGVGAGTPRGYFPGFSVPLHNRPLTTYTIYTGAGTYAGKTFMAISVGTTGQILAEISNTF